MNRTELIEHIANGENSRVEFKRDDCHPDELATEMAALLNLEGGIVLLGVEDDGRISGLTRSCGDAEAWVMKIARQNIRPAIIPAAISPVRTCIDTKGGRKVGVVKLAADSPGKPYKARQGKDWAPFVRIGSISREATHEDEGLLRQIARRIRYERKAVLDSGMDDLDMNRVENYYRDVLKRSAPARSDLGIWRRLLLNSDLFATVGDDVVTSVAGLLLFGDNPNRRLPQAGVTAVAFAGLGKDYDTVDEERIRGPLTSRVSRRGAAVDRGVIDRTVDFVKRNMGSVAWLEGGRRYRKRAFPVDAVREAIVNAVAHRDYAREGTDIEVSLYRDCLEVISPGRLPNGVTVEKMRAGVVRVARNELLKAILRDYGYVGRDRMGVLNRIIESMRRHNGTEPDLVEGDDRFIVRLWKGGI